MLALHRHYCAFLTGPSYKVFAKNLFILVSCYIALIKWIFYYFVGYRCRKTTAGDMLLLSLLSLVMRLNIVIVAICSSVFVVLVRYFSSLKLENGKRNKSETSLKIKNKMYRLVKLGFFL